MNRFLKSFWVYLYHERLGYRRPMRLLTDSCDDSLEIERLERLERAVRYLDANIDLIRVSRFRKEPQ